MGKPPINIIENQDWWPNPTLVVYGQIRVVILDIQYIKCLCVCGLYIIIHINKHLSLLNLDPAYDRGSCLGFGCIFGCVNCLAIIAVIALDLGIPLGCTFQSDDIPCEGTFCYG